MFIQLFLLTTLLISQQNIDKQKSIATETTTATTSFKKIYFVYNIVQRSVICLGIKLIKKTPHCFNLSNSFPEKLFK